MSKTFAEEKFVNPEEKEKKSIREVLSENKETIAKVGIGTVVVLVYSKLVGKSMKKHNEKIFNLGKWAGRAEFAEELAEKAVQSGLKNN